MPRFIAAFDVPEGTEPADSAVEIDLRLDTDSTVWPSLDAFLADQQDATGWTEDRKRLFFALRDVDDTAQDGTLQQQVEALNHALGIALNLLPPAYN